MENEKSVYEIRLEEKDKIIKKLFKIIKLLIISGTISIMSLCGAMCFFYYQYFNTDYSSYGQTTTTINGDNNSSSKASVNDNKLNSSSIEYEQK